MASSRCSPRKTFQQMRRLEALARDAYARAALASDGEAGVFWRTVAEEEDQHFRAWDALLDDLPDRFPELDQLALPEDVISAIDSKAKDLVRTLIGAQTASARLGLAIQLEAMMLHPSCDLALARALECTNTASPRDGYDDHLARFKEACASGDDPSLAIAADMLLLLWQRNRVLEGVLLKATALRGLVPVCASCKAIRDDQDNWLQMEQYIANRSLAQFTHGICPVCAHSLYGIKPLEAK